MEQESHPDDSTKELIAKLIAMAQRDQAMREKAADGSGEWNMAIDDENTATLKSLVARAGWPKLADIGEVASQAAWTIAQHADHDAEFQTAVLNMMKQPGADVPPWQVAYLEDRVRVNSHEPQLYGTQFCPGEDGQMLPQPIEDEANVDVRRQQVGLEPLAEYAQVMNKPQS